MTMTPSLTTHPLARADGSATYTDPLFTILAAANGPVEVSRRDEIPDAAAIEVNVRPFSGVGGPQERWLESVIASLLRSVLLVHMHPRTLVQVTLQVTKDCGGDVGGVRMKSGMRDIAIVPSLANAAFAALVDGGLPLELTMIAGLAAISTTGQVTTAPTEKEVMGARSLHAMVFSQDGDMLLDESLGRFSLEGWQKAEGALRESARAALVVGGGDDVMVGGEEERAPWLRSALEEEARKAESWKEGG